MDSVTLRRVRVHTPLGATPRMPLASRRATISFTPHTSASEGTSSSSSRSVAASLTR